MPQGPDGIVEECFYVKKAECSQIPGFRYTLDQVSSVPKPITWTNQAITGPQLSCIELKKLEESENFYNIDDSKFKNASQNNPLW